MTLRSSCFSTARVRGVALLVLGTTLSLSPAVACKNFPRDNKETKDDLPPAATPVATPGMGISTGTPVIVQPPNPGGIAGAPASFAPLVRSAEPAVVTIVIKVKSKKGKMMMKGLGSGFIIDKAGTIITNNHVVTGGTAIEVVLFNDKTVEGKIVGTDPTTDVAVVKIEPPDGIDPIPLGDSESVAVGDWVVAIGNPLGLTHTVSAGILSARGRTTKDVPLKPIGGGEAYFDFLQTDAAINPGNSGGPLLNLKGEVIGMNTAINAAGQGLAFAIPINMVKQLIPSLVKEGHLVRSYLGVGIEDANTDSSGAKGAIVNHVWKDTPAEKAGLKENDRVLAIDGVAVRDAQQMRWLVSIAGVGKKVTLRIIRDEKAFDLPVTLEELPKKLAVQPGGEDEEDEE
jgi:serine protease Do